jgi:hypothetical protein
LRGRVDPFLVPFNFHSDLAILALAFNPLRNREIGTRGNQQTEGNY